MACFSADIVSCCFLCSIKCDAPIDLKCGHAPYITGSPMLLGACFVIMAMALALGKDSPIANTFPTTIRLEKHKIYLVKGVMYLILCAWHSFLVLMSFADSHTNRFGTHKCLKIGSYQTNESIKSLVTRPSFPSRPLGLRSIAGTVLVS